jgi:hypothetical protein
MASTSNARIACALATLLGGLAARADGSDTDDAQPADWQPADAQLTSTPPLAPLAGQPECIPVPCLPRPPPKRVLGGHRFMPSFVIPDPFATTQADFDMAFGYGTLPSGTGDNFQLVAISPNLNFQFAFFDRLAIKVGVGGTAVVGVDAFSVLNFGASTGYQFNFGVLFEIYRDRQNAFSFGLESQRGNTLGISPISAAASLVQNVLKTVSSGAFEQRDSWVVHPSLRYALGLNRWLGFKAMLGIDGTRRTGEDSSNEWDTSLNFGGQVSFDLHALTPVPLGFEAFYRHSQALTGNRGDFNSYGGGIYDSVLDRFSIGIELARVSGDHRSLALGGIMARYIY